MKRVLTSLAILFTVTALSADASAQSRPQNAAANSAAQQMGGPPAAALYEEAFGYVKMKFKEFERDKVPYSELLVNKTVQEQRELALRHAATLAARGPLSGTDLYHLGLLYSLADKPEGAINSLRRFIAETPAAPPEMAQNARRVLTLKAVQLNLLDEAEQVLAAYVSHGATGPNELYALENALAGAYYKKRLYAAAARHALESFKAAKFMTASNTTPRQRATTLFNAGLLLADSYDKAKQHEEARAAAQELRRLGLTLPSADLYNNATDLLWRYDASINPTKILDDPALLSATAPTFSELNIAQWLDQQPVKLADLRGRVVLLDFWATWCAPCVVTIPKLNSLHKKYKERELVVLGVSRLEGGAEGQQMTPAEEVAYLRQFKKRLGATYGFAVAESDDNHDRYGIVSFPTAVLIDRRGVVRFISVGYSDDESAALSSAIKKLLDEPGQ